MSDENPALRLGDLFAANSNRADAAYCYELARRLFERGNRYIADVMVEVGVLESTYEIEGSHKPPVYRVVQPHKHNWRIATNQMPTMDQLVVKCTCDESRYLPNRLPIEVPQ